MTTVNTVELKTQANRLLKRVAKHDVVIVTKRGHPCAAIVPVSEETLVDLLWEHSPAVQSRLKTSLKELQAGKVESLKSFAKRHGLT